ncbi:SKP1-like protein 6 [Pyrus ussuriensis x Pyrus communis]|uniref:SKP1-like protein 6 n=1 Tax=Pyrus ussuriensis x Pyrus communis TaxID=2448454 RepID=A0A5N5FCJ5_9ROSA|nr:SKP1-like protein 6 [Pyrus ussuriensis x Pyrus communis]KAB2613740.1 SKP1-like protein 6 [Pyrus ussuriensis x Pyrus communis]
MQHRSTRAEGWKPGFWERTPATGGANTPPCTSVASPMQNGKMPYVTIWKLVRHEKVLEPRSPRKAGLNSPVMRRHVFCE